MRILRLLARLIMVLMVAAAVVLLVRFLDQRAKDSTREVAGNSQPANGSTQSPLEAAFDRNVVSLLEAKYGALPARINDELELTQIKTANRTVSLYFRLNIDMPNVNRQSVKALGPGLKSQFCAEKAMQILAQVDIKVTFVMTDLRNRVLYRFFMNPKDCA